MTPKYVFLISPNNSGTTVMSQYFCNRYEMYLPPYGNNEGQKVPTVEPMMRTDPWNPNTSFDWEFIRKEWGKLLESSGLSTFFEASPPNLVRLDQILTSFPSDTPVIFSIANPYSYLGSCFFNYVKTPDRRQKIEKKLKIKINEWVNKATFIRNGISKYSNFPRISYEKFCMNPDCLDSFFSGLGFSINQLDENQLFGKRKLKSRNIIDMSPVNIAFFNFDEIEFISNELKLHLDLLEFFDYKILSFADYESILKNNLALCKAGAHRRVKWTFQNRNHGRKQI